MDKKLSAFLAQTETVSLTDQEKLSLRAELLSTMGTAKAAELLKEQQMHSHFTESASKLSLTTVEKADGFAALQSFMRQNPMQDAVRVSFFKSFLGSLRTTFSGASAFAFSFVIAGTAVAAVADSSLPGDALYPVKVYVYEPLSGAFRFTKTSQERWAVRRLEKRLKEAQILKTREFKPELEMELNKQLDFSAGAVADYLHKEAPDTQKDTVGKHLEKTLKRHEGYLTETEGVPFKAKNVRGLVDFVNREQEIIKVGKNPVTLPSIMMEGEVKVSSSSSTTRSSAAQSSPTVVPPPVVTGVMSSVSTSQSSAAPIVEVEVPVVEEVEEEVEETINEVLPVNQNSSVKVDVNVGID